MKNKEKSERKATAGNGRFGIMAAVIPQKRQCKFETLYSAGSSVEAATTPSRWDVSRQARTKQCDWEANKETKKNEL